MQVWRITYTPNDPRYCLVTSEAGAQLFVRLFNRAGWGPATMESLEVEYLPPDAIVTPDVAPWDTDTP